MVFYGIGHAYVKEKYPDGSIVWRCVKRNCKGRGTNDCYGSAKETVSGEFIFGKSQFLVYVFTFLQKILMLILYFQELTIDVNLKETLKFAM